MAEFTCEVCGETFEKVWADAEADAEAQDLFGVSGSNNPDMMTVCTKCFNEILARMRE